MNTKQFILLGLPGVEIEAQASLLADRWQVPQVSMPQLVDTAIAQNTAIAQALSAHTRAGDPIPDPLILKLLRQRLEQPDAMLKGWVLDGFPLTVAQAQGLDEWFAMIGRPAAIAVHLKAMTGILVNRIATAQAPGEPVSAAAIRQRLDQHQAVIAPLLDYYQSRSQLITINASLPFAEVARELAKLGQEDTGAVRLIPDEAELDTLLAQKPLLVVNCTASWCGSCKQVAPLIDKLAQTYRDRLDILKIDFDANRQITKRFGLQQLPAVMVFKQGELLETLTGVKPYQDYDEAIARLLG